MQPTLAQIGDPAEDALSSLVGELLLIVAERPDVTVKSNTVTSGNLPVDRERGVHFQYDPEVESGMGSATLSVTARRAKLTAHWRGEDGTVGNMEERLLLDLASSARCGGCEFQAMHGLAEALVLRLVQRMEELRKG